MSICHKNKKEQSFSEKQVSKQWRIEDFLKVGESTLLGGANIRFCKIFLKTAWNWKNLRGGGARPSSPLDLPKQTYPKTKW